MKLHRNSYTDKNTGLKNGFSFHSSAADASHARVEAKKKGLKGVGDVVEIGPGKQGVIDALNKFANEG